MAKNKNKKPQPPSNQEHAYDRTEGFGPGGRGRGRGRGVRGVRGGGVNGGGRGSGSSHGQDGSRGGGQSNFRGGLPPSAQSHDFGRGTGGRGRGPLLGRGRGFRGGVDSGSFTGDFRGGRPVYHPMGEVDFGNQRWNESQSGRNTPGGRGRGPPPRPSGNNTSRGRGGGGGRGGSTPKLSSTSQLSKLWYEERPLLQPIKFVRSMETATLFQEAEELLESTAQYPNETTKSHVPTADKVSQVFSSTHPHLFENSLFGLEEGIEEVNFEDLTLVHERVLNSAPTALAPPTVQEVFTGVSHNAVPAPEVQRAHTSGVTPVVEAELHDGHTIKSNIKTTGAVSSVHGGPPPLFFIDANPSMSQKQISVPSYHVHPHTVSIGENVQVEVESDLEDDVIVYNAPNPRVFTPKIEPNTLEDTPFSDHAPSSLPRQSNLRRGKFVHVVGRNARRGSHGIIGVKRKRLVEHKRFAAFGAMIAEARLRPQDGEEGKDPKEHLRRQGDSDLDWGHGMDEDETGEGPVTATAEGMDLDPDLVGSGVTMAAMEGFAEGIDENHLTMNDLEDVRTKGGSSDDGEEDESEGGSEGGGSESDEERMLMEEFIADQYGSDFSDDDEDDGDELDPMAGFQARLDRLRKKQQKLIEMGDDGHEDEMDPDFQWGEGEEIDEFFEGALDKYEKNRATRNAVPWTTQDGFSDELQPKASPSKPKELPVKLQEQWEKDRLRKAKRKNERELARLEAALDPLVTKKGGKKSKKAMIAAARLDPSIEIPHRVVDMAPVEQQIRRFLADKEKSDMALPDCNKSTRKKIHTLAALFGLKSKSKDGVSGRYVTLFKKKHSGMNVNEREVTRVMEAFKNSHDVSDDALDHIWKGKAKGKGGGKGKGKLKGKGENGRLKTREGDVVGHAAPKIDETNIGFMLLSSMGWSDGTTIGSSGGLDAPLTAVIKKTKLGLGAGASTKF